MSKIDKLSKLLEELEIGDLVKIIGSGVGGGLTGLITGFKPDSDYVKIRLGKVSGDFLMVRKSELEKVDTK